MRRRGKPYEPRDLEVQLAKLADAPPAGPEWIHEPKYDGYRILARKRAGRIRLLSRNNLDWTERFPSIAAALHEIRASSFAIDGELVAYDPKSKIAFQAMQRAHMDAAGSLLRYFVFDLIELNGRSMKQEPLERRRARLRELIPASRLVKIVPEVTAPRSKLLAWAAKHGFEGIVSKQRAAPYLPGRGPAWLKSKSAMREELLIVGYTRHSKLPRAIGALLVGLSHQGCLIYCGKVGTGFTLAERRSLLALLEPLRRKIEIANADEIPRPHMLVRPAKICEVSFTEWTGDYKLRHPVFLGLREDKRPGEVGLSTSSHPLAAESR